MAIGVGFDRIHAYSSPRHVSSGHCSSSPQCLGLNRISSSGATSQQNPTLQSSAACFFSPSFLQVSLPGSRSSSVARAKNHNTSSLWRRSRIGKLTSAKKCRQNLERNSLFGGDVNCVSCSATNSVQRDRDVISKVSASVRGCESSLGCSLANGADGEHQSCLFGGNACSRRPARRVWTIARCEAEGAGGGVSYDDGIATVNSGTTGTPGGADGYGEAGGEIAESRSDSDTSLITNGVSGEDAQTPPGSLKDVQQVGEDERGEDSTLYISKEILRVAQEDLENCKRNSKNLEENAQRIAEKAFALKDEAEEAERLTNAAVSKLEELALVETRVLEELEKATASKAIAEDVVNTAQTRLDNALSKAKAEDGAEVVLIGQKETEKKEEAEKKEEDEKQEFVEAKVQVTTERTVDISVMPVERDDSAERDVLKERDTTLAKTEVTVEGVTAEVAIAIASDIMEETEALENAKCLLRDSEGFYKKSEAELSRIQSQKENYEQDVARLREAAERAKETAFAADEDAARAMAEAEQAVAVQLEAAQRVGDAEVALQKEGSYAVDAAQQASNLAAIETEKLALSVGKAVEVIEEELENRSGEEEATRSSAEGTEDGKVQVDDGVAARSDTVMEKEQDEVVKPAAPPSPEVAAAVADKTAKESEPDNKKAKEPEPVKEPAFPKSSKKRSSRFFAASYFSSEDGEEFSPGKAYAEFAKSMKSQLAKVVVGVALLFAGGAYMNNRMDNRALQLQPPAYTTSIDQANANAKPIVAKFRRITKRVVNIVNKLPAQEVSEEEASLFDVLWLLLASVIFVPLFTKIPGGSPVLGYLVAGVLIGPHTIHIIQNVHGTKAIAEFGVVFLLFNIGLELSVERLSSMKKYVFGLGTAQVVATAAGIGFFLSHVSKITGPPAIIIASGLALSSTAVVLQVLQERGESTSRHGRATFSVLLFQDLAVVVLLILIPLLSAKGGVGLKEIGAALGVAGIKAVVAIVAIIASGRLFLRPIYKQMADNRNAEIFAANTLLVVLGTSLLTARAGLSMALGAFLAGLLLAETEFALQVESDIAPYRGLLLGLFFMTVGMSIDPNLLVAKFPEIASALALLIFGKTLLVATVGRLFGLSTVAAVRTGLLLAPGGEFAFVAFGEAVNQGIMSSQLSSLLFLVVGLSMALTPWLAAGGQIIAARFDQQDVRSLLPQESETDDLKGHIIICGFGRVGQIIAQLLSERLIPFVALDVRSDRVSIGRQLDLPVYFGDAGSKEVLHKIGANRAAAAVITLDTPGANYRTVWALCKHFPGVKTFVRAHDVQHGLNLEKAGATAVVPETLEPSLQLAAAVLAQAKVPAHEIASAIDEFRGRHLAELTELSDTAGTSLGYGFSKIITKPLLEALKIKPDNDSISERQKDGTIVAVP